jgi:hypothetical protein
MNNIFSFVLASCLYQYCLFIMVVYLLWNLLIRTLDSCLFNIYHEIKWNTKNAHKYITVQFPNLAKAL